MTALPPCVTMAGMIGVHRPLARPDAIGMRRIDHEAGAAVLHQDAGFRRHAAAAEAVIDRVDEAHRVAVLVDRR